MSQTPVDNETAGELNQGSTDQTPPAKLPGSHDPALVPEPDSKSAEIQSDADQVKSGASAAGTQQTSSGGTV